MRTTLPPLFLPRSPLVVVLGQVRFSPILMMESYIPAIQDELRRSGFPGFRKGVVDEVTWSFAQNASADPAVETVKRPRWEFFAANATWRIVLTEDALTLATSEYVRYEEPFERFMRTALAALDTGASLQVVTRLGLRYVDLVQAASDESLGEYLHPKLLGVPAEKLGMREATPYIQIRGTTEAGLMVVRCVFTDTGQSIPPDLADLELPIRSRPPVGTTVAILDFDHFAPVQIPFQLEETMDRLSGLHDTLDVAFRNSVTPVALERWGAEVATARTTARKRGGTK
jgi:uncharacterized protein (TIGR04255 family)